VQRLTRVALWGAVVFTFVMATLPKPPHLPGDPDDKVQHILAFACLTALASIAYARASAWRLALPLAVFAALIEVTQMIPALNRDAELMDWIADMTAIAVVLLAVRGGRRLRSG